MPPPLQDVRSSVIITGSSQGLDRVANDLNAVSAAQEQVAATGQTTATVTDIVTKRVLSTASAFERMRAGIDPAVKAAQQFERGVALADKALRSGDTTAEIHAQTVARLKARYDEATQSIAAAEQRVKGFNQAAAERPAFSVQATIDRATGVTRPVAGGDRGADIAAYGQELDGLRAKYNPLFAAGQVYKAQLLEIAHAAKVGAINEGERAAAITKTKEAFAKQVVDLKAANNGGLAGHQVQNLAYQGTDIVTSLAGGMNPLMVAMQQGGQIIPMFSGPGSASVKGALTQAGEAATAMAARIGVAGGAIGGLTVAVGLGAYAWSSYRSEQKAIEQSLSGIGRASGATREQINAVAEASARTAGISTSFARTSASEYAATGRIGVEMYGRLQSALRDYAAATGQDAAEANTALAQAFADPLKGAQALNERLGFLNATTLETIRRQQESGDRLGAQRTLFDAFAGSVAKASDRMGWFAREWERFKTNTSNEVDAIGGFLDRAFGGGTLESKLATAQALLAEAEKAKGGLFDGVFGTATSEAARLQAVIADLQAQIQAGAKASKEAQLNDRSLEIKGVVDGLNPARQAIAQIEAKAQNIRKALDEGVLDPDGRSRRSMDGLLAQAAQLRKDLAAGGSEFADAIRNAQFNLKTVGYSATALSAAEIEKKAEDAKIALDRRDIDPGERLAQLYTIEETRKLETERLRLQTLRAGAAGGGRFATSIDQVPERYRDLILNKANQYGQDPDLIASIIKRESNFNPNARSKAGAEGLAQFMPETARGMGLSNPFDPEAAIDAMVRHVRDLNVKYNGSVPDILSGYNRGGPRTDAWIAKGRDIATMPKETRDYIEAITKKPPGADAQIQAQNDRNRGLENEQRQLDVTKQYLDRNGVAYDTQTRYLQLLSQAQQQGIPITDELKASYLRTAEGMAQASRLMSETRLGRDLTFERQQLGRTDGEQAAYSRARSQFGDTTSYAAQSAIDQQLLNDRLRQTKDLAKEAFSGFTSDLMHGASAADALNNALSRVADRLLNLATDKIFSSLFGSLLGGGGGSGGGFNIMSLLGGGGGGGGLPTMAAGGFGPDMPVGYDVGGYTGPGGRFEPAGVVHRGEVVWSQDDVRRSGGVAAVEAMRRGLTGYAVGGYVAGGDGLILPGRMPARPEAAGGPGRVEVNVHNAPAGTTATAQVTQTPQGPRVDVQLQKMVNDMVQSGALDKTFRQRFGMRSTG